MGPHCLGTVGSKRNHRLHPVHHDRVDKITSEAKSERGGTSTIGVPEYKMTVTNFPDPNEK